MLVLPIRALISMAPRAGWSLFQAMTLSWPFELRNKGRVLPEGSSLGLFAIAQCRDILFQCLRFSVFQLAISLHHVWTLKDEIVCLKIFVKLLWAMSCCFDSISDDFDNIEMKEKKIHFFFFFFFSFFSPKNKYDLLLVGCFVYLVKGYLY